MIQILRPLLLPAVLLRAAWLRHRRVTMPAPPEASGWKGRFHFAVWVAMVAVQASAQPQERPTVMCYEMMPPAGNALEQPLSRVRVIWMALDSKQGPALESALRGATFVGDVEIGVSNFLVRIHRVLAQHNDITRVQRITCYKMTAASARRVGHQEAALAQLEALAEVRAKGKVLPEVLSQAEKNLREELRQLGIEPAPAEKEVLGAAKLLTAWYGAEPKS